MALRGVQLLTAMSLVTELGDISRFDSPRELMAYVGLVPSEHTSGGKQKRGGITKTGNGRVRRLLVEAAWSYRFPARQSPHTTCRRKRRRRRNQRRRLHGRRRSGCAIATGFCNATERNQERSRRRSKRELSGFVWARRLRRYGRAELTSSAAVNARSRIEEAEPEPNACPARRGSRNYGAWKTNVRRTTEAPTNKKNGD